ncbi:MAG: 50S ribosomal protein L1 [Phycisphaeraceae bacterium]|nr:50S ribosomal protein L1 [Phycisphaeraceae bacterium]MCW5762707.1 50S ribosomal protein L1 [Phycisphaeraceae bacterium]
MPQRTKKQKVNDSLRPTAPLDAPSAVSLLKKFQAPKFDQTVEVVMHLGVDTKQADQMLRGSVSLPRGIGKAKRVIAFCPSDVVAKAMAAGALKAGGEDLVEEVEKGFFDFDVAVASPDMMRVISKLGRVLGPKGLMPSPKNGTVAGNVPDAVKEFAAGKVEYRTDKGGNVHAVIGKMSFPESHLVENLEYFITTIEKVRPSTVKGVYIRKITLSGTMTPGVQLKYETAAVEA